MIPPIFEQILSHFHLYGIILAVAVGFTWFFTTRLLGKIFSDQEKETLYAGMLLSAVLGARLWHIATDWEKYQDNLWSIFLIWRGGLSIFGALLGGAIGITVVGLFLNISKKKIISFVDVMAMTLPFAQAIGRLGNWVNQELYGFPTDLPWKIYIDKTHRLPEFIDQEYYHPLFLYEMMGNIIVGLGLWFAKKRAHLKLGDGKILTLYLIGYGALRFFLDFLRPDKTMLGGLNLGTNQVLILVFAFISIFIWFYRFFENRMSRLTITILAIISLVIMFGYMTRIDPDSQGKNSDSGRAVYGHLVVNHDSGTDELRVEVVDTPQKITLGLSGREEIGADGMLFDLPEPRPAGFWMKEMGFPLDMIWIRNNKITGIEPDVPFPPPNTPESKLKVYYSPGEVDKVLEVPAGTAGRRGWQVGDIVEFELD